MPPPSLQHAPASIIASFIDRSRIDRILVPWVPDAADRSFIVRCLLDEGPAHHRGANYVLLSLLGDLASAQGSVQGPSVPVPMRLTPHAGERGEDGNFPIRLPTAVLERLAPAGSPEHQAMIDSLIDGPPQHALGNVAMICLLARLLSDERPA